MTDEYTCPVCQALMNPDDALDDPSILCDYHRPYVCSCETTHETFGDLHKDWCSYTLYRRIEGLKEKLRNYHQEALGIMETVKGGDSPGPLWALVDELCNEEAGGD